jgi:hypothetical protein
MQTSSKVQMKPEFDKSIVDGFDVFFFLAVSRWESM